VSTTSPKIFFTQIVFGKYFLEATIVSAVVSVSSVACVLAVASVHAVANVPSVSAVVCFIDSSQQTLRVSLTPVKKNFPSTIFELVFVTPSITQANF